MANRNISSNKTASMGTGKTLFKMGKIPRLKTKNVQEPTPELIEAHKKAAKW
jgi:tRNA A37 threonylcarbamoyladenosine biosynthesis protein TsaE